MKSDLTNTLNSRGFCYKCYRPESSCMCKYIKPIHTNTRFIILMHPKEFNRTKNGTGHFTNLSLYNCEIYIGVDFSKNNFINKIINDPTNICYVLYPSTQSINLNEQSIKKQGRNSVVFIIDSTWPCSRKILASSPNIENLQKVSFTHSKVSGFKFKEQPQEYCLSTMESTLCVLELLNKSGSENIGSEKLRNFLLPFEKMVEYQLSRC